ncbi:MAG TPA: class I SAM-dependent methyltransferase [Phycisphaerae bacterium]|nr:class I SAM-dependent methyltransferase [Phycisphaerae bacterium]
MNTHTHAVDSPQHPTRRFSVRVSDYIKYRPGYPPALLEDLRARQLLTPRTRIADIGSGTGLLAKLFLEAGNGVIGIEPNADMRAAGDAFLAEFPAFGSREGTAEATGLADRSIDLIVAGQAFHWFDQPRTRAEFERILAPGGGVALVWNERLTHSPFLQAYEALVHTYATDYTKIDHRRITDDVLREFFAPHPMRITSHPNSQRFDFQALRGRLLSSSYAPLPGDPRHEPMLESLRRLFDEHQSAGCVAFDYLTKMHTARMK